MLPVYQIVADGMTLAHVEMPKFRITQRLWRLQKPAMPALAIMQVPTVPDPMIVE